MYIKKLIAILVLNYLPIFFWILFYDNGLFIIALLLPVNVLIMSFDYILSYGMKELWTAFLHLTVANSLGAVLQAFLMRKYPVNRSYTILIMLIEILFFTAFILIGKIVLKKPVSRKKRAMDEKYAQRKEAYDKYIAEHKENDENIEEVEEEYEDEEDDNDETEDDGDEDDNDEIEDDSDDEE